jgi:hypothetical protein
VENVIALGAQISRLYLGIVRLLDAIPVLGSLSIGSRCGVEITLIKFVL